MLFPEPFWFTGTIRFVTLIAAQTVLVALIGVAASTSFAHSRYATLMPGQSTKLDGYTFRYVKPTASASAAKISFGAKLAISQGGHPIATVAGDPAGTPGRQLRRRAQ